MIEGYESSPKTKTAVVDHNRGSSGRSGRHIHSYPKPQQQPVTSQLHPVTPPPYPLTSHHQASPRQYPATSQQQPVTSQLYPVTSQPEIYYGFKPMISEEEERERDSVPGPTEATLADFPIPDIGQQLQTLYQVAVL